MVNNINEQKKQLKNNILTQEMFRYSSVLDGLQTIN